MRELKVGMAVVFIDEDRKENPALITAIHGDVFGRVNEYQDGKLVPTKEGAYWPCVNLVHTSLNKDCQDQYGRQMERHSSIAHLAQNSAQGFCYRFVDEEVDSSLRQPAVS